MRTILWPPSNVRRDVVVLGASAGGVEALSELLTALPGDFPAIIALALHRSPTLPSLLLQVLGRHAALSVVEPQDGERPEQSVVYVAPADRHMLIRSGVFRLDRTAKYHHSRPAVDPLFESAALEFGPRVIGVILTGNLSDGVAGLIAIHKHGGVCLAQDSDEAAFPSMPLSALRQDHVNYVFRQAELPALLTSLVGVAPASTLAAPLAALKA